MTFYVAFVLLLVGFDTLGTAFASIFSGETQTRTRDMWVVACTEPDAVCSAMHQSDWRCTTRARRLSVRRCLCRCCDVV